MLPSTDVTLLYIIYFQSISGLLALSNIVYIYTLITFANKRYGNFKNWFCTRKHGSNTMLIACIRWIVGIIQGTMAFLFRFNIFFQYSSDNYQNDCAGGIDCLSCIIYLPTRQSLLSIGLGLEYMLMIQLLKDTLTLSKILYSRKLFRCIVAAVAMPVVAVVIVSFSSIKTEIHTTVYHQDIHVCKPRDPSSNSNLRFLELLGSFAGVWVMLLGFLVLFLFLSKLRQVKLSCITSLYMLFFKYKVKIFALGTGVYS